MKYNYDLETALKKCDLRNPVHRPKHIERLTTPKIVGYKPKNILKGMDRLDYKGPENYWTNVKKIRTDRTHQRWFDFNLTKKYNKDKYVERKTKSI